jgi:plastocyanin
METMRIRLNVKLNAAVALVGLVTLLALQAGCPAVAQGDERTFRETGKTVQGKFLKHWNANGGLAQQGFPISEEVQERSDTDGKLYTVQYFERTVFEFHPENRAPNDVLLSLLGVFEYRRRYGAPGAPAQVASTSNPRRFAETGKTIGGAFRAYWERNGGLAQQGFPISEEFKERSTLDGKEYRVQYFQRAVFEYHPENAGKSGEVLLSQLGTFRSREKYGAAGPQPPTQAVIDISGFTFQPDSITVKVGAKVTWRQQDYEVHNATSTTGLWAGPLLNIGEEYSYTFTRPGVYEYLCEPHQWMRGVVRVVP